MISFTETQKLFEVWVSLGCQKLIEQLVFCIKQRKRDTNVSHTQNVVSKFGNLGCWTFIFALCTDDHQYNDTLRFIIMGIN